MEHSYEMCAETFRNVSEPDEANSRAQHRVVVNAKHGTVDTRHITKFLPMTVFSKMLETCAHVQNQYASENGRPPNAADLRFTYKKIVYTRAMLHDIRCWHKIRPMLTIVEDAAARVQDISSKVGGFIPDDVFVGLVESTPAAMADALKKFNLRSPASSFLRFVDDQHLDDTCMSAVMWHIRRDRENVKFLSPCWTSIPFMPTMSAIMKQSKEFEEPDGKLYLIAVNLEVEKHWCSTVIDLRGSKVAVKVLDPLQQYVT
jgi:hypothetical protein